MTGPLAADPRTPSDTDGVAVVRATEPLLTELWARDIAAHPGDPQWLRWREEYLQANRTGGYRTYLITVDGTPVGQGTLALDPTLPAIKGRTMLGDGRTRGYVTALRIHRTFEGRGYISRLMALLEADARALGLSELAIGVEPEETRNRAIYTHWGYTALAGSFPDGGSDVLCYVKTLTDPVD